jgi:hypothetical protein
MSDQTRNAAAATDDAWWRGELVRFSARARHWLGKNFSSLKRLHDDLIGETLVHLTGRLGQSSGGLPPAWFEAAEPPEDDVRRFQALALTVLNAPASAQAVERMSFRL